MKISHSTKGSCKKNDDRLFPARSVRRSARSTRIGVGRAAAPLPPNRTGGSPAYGSPVGGVTSMRIDESNCLKQRRSQTGDETDQPVSPPRVVNMRHWVRNSAFSTSPFAEAAPACLAGGTRAGWLAVPFLLTHPPPCVPFAPSVLP
jgi:hypothetical protein